MNRLTQKDRYGHYYTNEKINDRMQDDELYPHAYDGKAIDRLGEYEDAEEQGLILRLPCKVGDVVYKPNPITMKEIVEIEIESIFISASGTNISGRTTKMKYSFCCSPSDFGKSVFLTKEAAEQALKETKKCKYVKDNGLCGKNPACTSSGKCEEYCSYFEQELNQIGEFENEK